MIKRYLFLFLPVAAAAGALAIACNAPSTSTTSKVLTSPPAAEKGRLVGKTIAILATNGVEQSELVKPQRAFAEEGAKTVVIAPNGGTIQGMNHADKGDKITVDLPLAQARPEDYDALVLPGGVANPDTLRTVPAAVAFAKAFAEAGKPISAICHGPWLLVEADVVRDRTMTSWPSLRRDLENAGAKWIDADAVTDNGLTTSRKPDDIPAFVKKSIEELTEPRHARAKHAQSDLGPAHP